MADHPAEAEAEALDQKPYNTADPAQVNAANKRAARHRRERMDVVATLMGQAPGRAWLYDHLEFCNIFGTTFVDGDPHKTSFKEGGRNIGLRLLADVMEAAPDQYVTMIREGKAPRK